MSKYKVLEEYHIQVIEYDNGYKTVKDINKNENCSGIYIYADESKYDKRHIDELLNNSISKDKIKELMENTEKEVEEILKNKKFIELNMFGRTAINNLQGEIEAYKKLLKESE